PHCSIRGSSSRLGATASAPSADRTSLWSALAFPSTLRRWCRLEPWESPSSAKLNWQPVFFPGRSLPSPAPTARPLRPHLQEKSSPPVDTPLSSAATSAHPRYLLPSPLLATLSSCLKSPASSLKPLRRFVPRLPLF